MATRVAAGDDDLVKLLREREGLVADWMAAKNQSVDQLSAITHIAKKVKPKTSFLQIQQIDSLLSDQFPQFSELTHPKAVNYRNG